jgi:hypothetical protein
MKDAQRTEDPALTEIRRRFRRGREVLACRRHAPMVARFLDHLESGADCDDAVYLKLDEHSRCFECQVICEAMLGETGPSDDEQERAVTALLASIKDSRSAASVTSGQSLRAVDGTTVSAPAADAVRVVSPATRLARLGRLLASARWLDPRGGPFHARWSGVAAAAAAVVLVLAGTWLVTVRSGPGGPRLLGEPARPSVDSSIGRVPESSSASAEVYVTLSPGLTRSAGVSESLVLAAGVKAVHVRLSMERDPSPRYNVSLETPEGRQLWQVLGVPTVSTAAIGPAVSIVLPAMLLSEGDYLIHLVESGRGGQVVDVYPLRVVRP